MSSKDVSGQTADTFESSTHSKLGVLTSQGPLWIGKRHMQT